MNALLYTTNTQPQALTAGQQINFGTPVRRYGRNLQVSGGNITANGEGYYPVVANVSFTAEDTGLAVFQLYENGLPIPGARAEKTVAADSVYDLSVPAAFRIKCCEERTISATITGVDSTVSTASVLAFKA